MSKAKEKAWEEGDPFGKVLIGGGESRVNKMLDIAIKEAKKDVFEDFQIIIQTKYYKWKERDLLLKRIAKKHGVDLN